MNALLLFSTVSLCVSAGPISPEENDNLQKTCGKFGSSLGTTLSRSMGTENATRKEAPWTVAFRLSASGKLNDSKNQCAGTVISSRHIVTAAHCVTKMQTCCNNTKCEVITTLRNMLIVDSTVCQESTCDSSIIARVRKIYSSRDFDWFCTPMSYILGDVAVMELEENLQFNSYLQPACLNMRNPPVGTNLTIFGYGMTATNPGGVLRKHPTNVVPREVCRRVREEEMSKFPGKLEFDTICTRSVRGKACHGDSGSGQLYFNRQRAYLTGIMSYISKACHPSVNPANTIDFSASIAYHSRWIAVATGVNPGFSVSEIEKALLEKEYYVYE